MNKCTYKNDHLHLLVVSIQLREGERKREEEEEHPSTSISNFSHKVPFSGLSNFKEIHFESFFFLVSMFFLLPIISMLLPSFRLFIRERTRYLDHHHHHHHGINFREKEGRYNEEKRERGWRAVPFNWTSQPFFFFFFFHTFILNPFFYCINLIHIRKKKKV